MSGVFIEDNGILWLQRELVGTPPAWEPGKNYAIGDCVVPRNPTPSQASLMFQVVGFLVKTPSVAPTWPTTPDIGDTLISGDIEYVAQSPTEPPAAIAENQYYLFDRTITVT